MLLQLNVSLVEVKIKFTLEQAMKVQKGSGPKTLPFLSALDGGGW